MSLQQNLAFCFGELRRIGREILNDLVRRIHHRTRKVLGFRMPYEVSFGVSMSYRQPTVVALRTRIRTILMIFKEEEINEF